MAKRVSRDDELTRMERRKILKMIGGTAAINTVALAGCLGGNQSGTNGGNQSGTNGGNQGQAVSIDFWHTWSTAEIEYHKERVQEWLNQHPNWTINTVSIPQDARRQKITSAVSTENLPDILRAPYPYHWLMAETGDAAALDKYWQDWDGANDVKDSLVEFCRYDDELIAWPEDVFTPAIYYRQDIFNEAGINSFPQQPTYEEFVSACEKITENTESYAVALPVGKNSTTLFMLAPFIWSSGGGLATREDNREWTVEFDSSNSIKGLERYTSLVEQGFAPDSVANYGYAEVHQGWESGEFGIMASGTWSIENLKINSPDIEYRIVNFPKMKETGTFIVQNDASMYIVSESSDNIEQSVDYIKWLTNKENVRFWSNKTGHIPIRSSVEEGMDKFSEEKFKPFTENQKNEHATSWPKVGDFSVAIQDPVVSAAQSVVLGNKSPDEAAKDAAKTMRDELQ